MSGKVVLVTGHQLYDEARALLDANGIDIVYSEERIDSAELAAIAAQHRVDGIIVRQGVIDDTVMAASDRLVVLSRHGVGVDLIDLEAATRRGLPVLKATGANASSAAEHTIGLIYALIKDFFALDRSVRQGHWGKHGHIGREIAGLRLGLIGCGAIGSIVARTATRLGMQVQVFDPATAVPDGIGRTSSLDELLTTSEVVSLHCPLTAQNMHMMNADTLWRMPRGAFLINTARGGLVEEDALIAGLQSGHLGGAALDCYAQEPPPQHHPLWQMSNVILTPHIAGAGRSGMKAMAMTSVKNVLDTFAGHPLRREVLANPAVVGGPLVSPAIKFE
ncbi:hydroxyacid dehydrogenase [Puniceibacterium sp. IMCC21224]|uniref:hydroxyacid dehydrogenase n=1 Tax=Puniceibacterium sp. IMCC21224 TaxID=1618204 RepID=UPI00064E05E0|nr:hydroxyacid dehydrogenase [Puniceibacterium sp. IMCC21224]KMK67648.1 phosphoglycerate dehydrogenase-like oxidoreductase [Puniceibacterium sp. IMCC21224]